MEALVAKYRRKGVLIDANLLLGYLVGSIHPRHLANCRATTRYFGEADFPLLNRFLIQFDRIITTPHVLTEVSNLGGRLQTRSTPGSVRCSEWQSEKCPSNSSPRNRFAGTKIFHGSGSPTLPFP